MRVIKQALAPIQENTLRIILQRGGRRYALETDINPEGGTVVSDLEKMAEEIKASPEAKHEFSGMVQ